jgi:hypothetical protein
MTNGEAAEAIHKSNGMIREGIVTETIGMETGKVIMEVATGWTWITAAMHMVKGTRIVTGAVVEAGQILEVDQIQMSGAGMTSTGTDRV